MKRVVIAPACLAAIEDEARAAFPRECCGLLEGRRRGGAVEITASHPTRNGASEADRFEIDPADHLRLLRGTRDSGTEIVGCYHSHPNGRAEPSPQDKYGASETGFVWLIAALAPNSAVALAAFVMERSELRPILFAGVG